MRNSTGTAVLIFNSQLRYLRLASHNFQRPARVFTNNIVVRFHPGLEIDGDEVITVVCRYPPPIVPLPALALPVQ
jgi:hypothetical protein